MSDKDAFEAQTSRTYFSAHDADTQATIRPAVEFDHSNSRFVIDGRSGRLKQVWKVFSCVWDGVLFSFVPKVRDEKASK